MGFEALEGSNRKAERRVQAPFGAVEPKRKTVRRARVGRHLPPGGLSLRRGALVLVVGLWSTAGTGLVHGQSCPQLLADPSFEQENAGDSPWAEASTNFSTPLCSVDRCGPPSWARGAGSWWAW